MKRREFISAAAGLAAGGTLLQGQATAGPLIELWFLRMHQGEQVRRMNAFFSQGVLPLARKLGFPKPPFGPWGFFTVEMGPSPTLVEVLSFPTPADREKVHQMMFGPEMVKLIEALEAEPEPPMDRGESSLLQVLPFSPPLRIAAQAPKVPRVFELRIYASDTVKRQTALVKRMAEAEVALFTKAGFDNIFFANCLIGANVPNFTYLIAFDDMAARDKAWAAFRADPEWVKVREASIKESGQIVSNITNYILRPTPYSPMQ
jgi:hypothetical protein